MALGATIYSVEVDLADHDRQVYESIELKRLPGGREGAGPLSGVSYLHR